ncbi:FadR/GntR family transcriptional regulator [Herbaspirillum sp. RV1423]|uniref:FadR/GntR family transcriptional regulator n=1 Tax=Herbaspirillum sp. RV1423 TaxID=1443993 RepID=UPI0004B05942|nr:FadR/GntR family transcriptional regulator [Herbaspirillum sp. RV1423]
MSSFHPVSVTRLYRMIADQIACRIRAEDFRPGERLPSERELAEQLQVSRPSIREALIALEIEGYVEVRVGTGVFVTQRRMDRTAGLECAVSEVGPFDLLAARLLVEPECAALAARHATQTQLAAIDLAARNLHGSVTPRAHDRAFHLAIAEGCGNPALVSTVMHLMQLRDSSNVLKRLEQHFVTNQVWQQAADEHELISRAIRTGDEQAARHVARLHLTDIQDRLHRDFGSDPMQMERSLGAVAIAGQMPGR